MKICIKCNKIYDDKIMCCLNCSNELQQLNSDGTLSSNSTSNNSSYVQKNKKPISPKTKKIIVLSIISVIILAVSIMLIVSLTKSPALKIMEKYVSANNDKSISGVAETIYPDKNTQEYLDFVSDNRDSYFIGLEKMELTNIEVVEKYSNCILARVTLKITIDFLGTDESVYELYFIKEDNKWHLASDIDYIECSNSLPNDFIYPSAMLLSLSGFSQSSDSYYCEVYSDTLSIPEGNIKLSDGATYTLSSTELTRGVNNINITVTSENGEHRNVYHLTVYYPPFDFEIVNGNAVLTRYYQLSEDAIEFPEFLNGAPVTEIGGEFFADCANIRTIELPDFIKKITISDNVTSISNWEFDDCTNLTGVTIGNGLTSISYDTFSGCTGLTTIIVADNNDTYHSNGNCLIQTADKTLILGCKNSIIPNDGSVTRIGDCAFYNCRGLSSLTVPNSITSIGNRAFESCSALTSLTIPDSVTSIGYGAFGDCGKLEYQIYNNNLEYLNNWLIKTVDVNITSAQLKNTTVGIYDSAFSECTYLTSITLPNSVKSIGDSAFYNCSALTSVTVGNSVTSIGNSAFYYCSSLASITIPSSVTSIGYNTFYNCSGLTNITIPDSVTTIGYYAFYNCTNLEYEIYNSNLKYLNNWLIDTVDENITSAQLKNTTIGIYCSAFEGCSNLTSIIIPNSVKSIGDSTFYNCWRLTSITIPNSVLSIGNSAFSECGGLTSITIPSGVTSIGEGAFHNCGGLTSIAVDSNNNVYHSNGNCLIQTADKILILGCKNSIIPNDGSVISIGNYAFSECHGLTSITIPSSVTSIGRGAFFECNYLTSITIPSSVTSIGDSAFYDCNKLTSITIPSSVTSIGYSAFYECRGLTSVTIPNSVTSIGNSAFYDCNSLTSITIPNSVTSIGHHMFYGCSGLKSVTIGNSVTSIGEYAFLGCSDLTSITVASNNDIFHSSGNCLIQTADKTLILGCKNSIIPDDGSVTSIEEYAFYNCSDLTSVTIPSGVTRIGDYAFSGCTGMTNIIISNSVISIGNYAFSSCFGLTSIIIPSSVTSIGHYAFYNCSDLTSVTFTNTTGWYRTLTHNGTSGTNASVTNASTNATNLTSSYYSHYWYRK